MRVLENFPWKLGLQNCATASPAYSRRYLWFSSGDVKWQHSHGQWHEIEHQGTEVVLLGLPSSSSVSLHRLLIPFFSCFPWERKGNCLKATHKTHPINTTDLMNWGATSAWCWNLRRRRVSGFKEQRNTLHYLHSKDHWNNLNFLKFKSGYNKLMVVGNRGKFSSGI